MIKLLKKILITLLIALLCIVLIETKISKIIEKYQGPTTLQRISRDFKNTTSGKYENFFFGNSRMCQDINPDMFDNYYAYNFGFDNESYNQIYYKLLYLEKHNITINSIVINVDYESFSFIANTRNFVYDLYLGWDYIKDYGNIFKEISNNINMITTIIQDNFDKSFVNTIFNFPIPDDVAFQRDNGQYITTVPNKFNDGNYSMLDFQIEYFDKIIAFCSEKNIEVYVVMFPYSNTELSSYGMTNNDYLEFDNFIKEHLTDKYENNYYNLTYLEEFYNDDYYLDYCHLKEIYADKLSLAINEIVNWK